LAGIGVFVLATEIREIIAQEGGASSGESITFYFETLRPKEEEAP
jgi:uncharacterized protein YoaH (UPF0181 family)